MIINSVALQVGKDPLTFRMKFFHGKFKKGKPTSLITPADGRGRFWLHYGIRTEKELFLFLMRKVTLSAS